MRNEREAHPQFSGWITEQGRMPILTDEEIAALYANDERSEWEAVPDQQAIWMIVPWFAIWCVAMWLLVEFVWGVKL